VTPLVLLLRPGSDLEREAQSLHTAALFLGIGTGIVPQAGWRALRKT
jgi:hypothetical protein